MSESTFVYPSISMLLILSLLIRPWGLDLIFFVKYVFPLFGCFQYLHLFLEFQFQPHEGIQVWWPCYNVYLSGDIYIYSLYGAGSSAILNQKERGQKPWERWGLMTNRYCRAIGEQRAAAASRQTDRRKASCPVSWAQGHSWIVTCNFNV